VPELKRSDPSPLDIDLIEVGTHKSLKSQLKDAVAAKLPYGTYIVRVSAPGFRRSEREFLLDQPESSVRIQLSVAVECGGVTQVRGGIRPASADRELWVKLVPLRGVGGSEARVGRDGSFLVGGLEDGQYLLLIVDGTAIVHVCTHHCKAMRRSVSEVASFPCSKNTPRQGVRCFSGG
jgi:hypothetical protein